MSEKDIFDEKLVNKFRDTLENYEAAYNPAQWEQIKNTLPRSPLMSVWRNTLKQNWGSIAAAMTALVVVAYIYWKPNSTHSQSSKVIGQEVITQKEGQNPSVDALGHEQKTVEIPTNQTPTANKKDQQTSIDTAHAYSIDKKIEEINQISENNNIKDNNIRVEKKQSALKQNNQLPKSTENETNLLSHTLTAQNSNFKTSKIIEEKNYVVFLPIYQDSVVFAFHADLPKPTPAVVVLEAEETAKKPKRSIMWGLATNPTIFRNELDNQLTIESGLQMSIPIASRLRLVTGLLVSNQRMNYSKNKTLAREFATNPKDLDPANVVGISSAPQQNWVELTATMRNAFTILHVPVQLQYDFMYKEKMRFFASVGTANFTYLSERYDYTHQIEPLYVNTSNRFGYGTATKYDVNYSRSYSAFSWIDLANSIYLSTGIEFPLSNHFFLQASPFVRVPIRRVGHQGLAFDTFGLSVVMNYK
jgi:hypothetical protein